MSLHIETSILMAVLFMKTRPIDIKIMVIIYDNTPNSAITNLSHFQSVIAKFRVFLML